VNAQPHTPIPRLWEWTAQLEEGVSLTSGEPWRGHRVRYREQGTRRWSSFLLSVDGDELPTETMVVRAIEAHAAQ
jgi:hypothetical protein